MIDQIHLGDCLEVMPRIPNGSVDMILCDLPYGTTHNKWDTVIPFGSLWEQYWRVAKPNAAVVLFAAQPFTTSLVFSQIQHYKYELVWIKNLKTGNLNARHRPRVGHETIQVFYKSTPTYNPQKRKRTDEIPSGNKWNSRTANYGKQKKEYVNRQSDEINPDTALLNFKCVHNSSGKLHPTEKPVELIEWLIRTYSNPGDVVLDNCSGSGVTAVGCLRNDRHFICIEKEPGYHAASEQRVIDELI